MKLTGASWDSQGGPSPEMVEEYLARGLILRRWFNARQASGDTTGNFPLTTHPDYPGSSYGFFAEIPSAAGVLPVIGSGDKMFYDRGGGRLQASTCTGRLVAAQLREFILRYFMRISHFPVSEETPETHTTHPAFLTPFSWCSLDSGEQTGLGFSQWMAKKAGTGDIVHFPESSRFAITDLRDVGPIYDWLVVKVRIFDFTFHFDIPATTLQLGVPLPESTYLVISPEFILDDTSAEGGTYGFGYAFIRDPPSVISPGFGPGEFDAAWQQFEFQADAAGIIQSRLIFIANRPRQVINIASFDPAASFIRFANAATFGETGRALCISEDHLARLFLYQHYLQHFQAVTGSAAVWRKVPDWTATSELPQDIREGRPFAF